VSRQPARKIGRMKLCTRHVNKDVNVHMNVMCIISMNDILYIVCTVRCSHVSAEELSEGKDVGCNVSNCH
jgi:hypothetical protein